ncbi:hypothetical protein JHK84_045128 [Glycine max]|nr:hypothetical protein JHK84_045128 [Glycine max]
MDWKKSTTIGNLKLESKSLLWKCSCSSLLFDANSSLRSFKESFVLKNSNMSEEFYCNDGKNSEIPTGFGYLLGLVSLNLSRNNLNGEIPDEIGNLNLLEFFDLSRNHFSGKIPSTLSKIDRLSVLDLSNNNLIGRIP